MLRQRGATLIEVLISVLILAVGLLGLAATQMMSMKNGNGTHHRYMATMAAHDMAERMRANPAGVEQGSYDGTVNGSGTQANSCSTSCGTGQLAAMDKYEWGQMITTNLPSGSGTISRNGGKVTVKVEWKEQHTGEDYGSAGDGLEETSFEMTLEL